MMGVNRNLIIAVDFDGTLYHGNWPGVGEPNRILIDKLLKLQNPILRDNTLCFIWCLSGTVRHDNEFWITSEEGRIPSSVI